MSYKYIYIYMTPPSDREVPPPNGMGPQVAPPFPSICKLLAAFLRSSLVFARFFAAILTTSLAFTRYVAHILPQSTYVLPIVIYTSAM